MVCLTVVLSAAIFPVVTDIHAQATAPEPYRDRFEAGITETAQRYVDLPYHADTAVGPGSMLDNSHLFHRIYREAARKAGMRYLGYAPLEKLLERAVRIGPEEIRVGDLFVLKDGLAAMIYKSDGKDTFYLIYASRKRQRIVSFNNRNMVFDMYWMKNLEGFYRLTRYNFSPNG